MEKIINVALGFCVFIGSIVLAILVSLYIVISFTFVLLSDAADLLRRKVYRN